MSTVHSSIFRCCLFPPALLPDPAKSEKHSQHVRLTVSLVLYMHPINDLRRRIKCAEREGGEKKKGQRDVWPVTLCCTLMSACSVVSLGAPECVQLCSCLRTLKCGFTGPEWWKYVCVRVCVCAHSEEMDIYSSSWLHFPGCSLMALCSGAELLLPTYFMTSCSPHANNSASPLTRPSLTLSAFYSISPFSLSSFFLVCVAFFFFFFLQMPKT